MRGILTDCRHAIRLYVRTPAASLIAVGMLALAMAFLGAFISMYVDVVVRPHPGFEPGGRLVTVVQTDGVSNVGISLELIERINEEMPALGGMGGIAPYRGLVTVGPDRQSLLIAQLTREYFNSLRPRMSLGRRLEPRDHFQDAEPVVVISYPLWQQMFDSDPTILGQTIELYSTQPVGATANAPPQMEEVETSFRIVGVLSPGLSSTSRGDPSLWVPYERFARIFSDNATFIRSNAVFWVFYRRGPGTPTPAVLRELNARYQDLGPELNIRPGFRLDGVEGLAFDIDAQRVAHRQLNLFLAGSVLLALVAATNVSLFLLARAPGRRRELGIRLALGAQRRRLARQLATEASLLVLASTMLGLLVSLWLTTYLRGLSFFEDVEWRNVELLDWRVLGFIGVIVFVLALLVSLAPIQALRRFGIAASSRQVASRATLAQRLAGTAQIIVASVLGGAAVAFAWYLGLMLFGSPGYNMQKLQVAYIQSPFFLQRSPEETIVASARRREAILSVAGVTDVAFGTLMPDPDAQPSIRPVAHPVEERSIQLGIVEIDSRFVELLGLTLLRGRAPMQNEPGVALVNETLARQVWGMDNVIGELLPLMSNGDQAVEIIGVLEDISFRHPNGDVLPIAFSTGSGGIVSEPVLIETELATAELQQALQALIDSGELEGNLATVGSLRDFHREAISPDLVRGLLTIATAVLVVLLAAFGLYGTQRYLVVAGRREYAIRASLGAEPKALGRHVYQRGLLLGLPGLLIGGLLAFIVVAWLRDEYVSREVAPGLVVAFVLSGLTLLLVTASVGPAREASRTIPASLLRED